MKIQELQITDEGTLREASAYLHDAVFQREHIQYDQSAQVMTLDLWRELWEETTSERFLLIFHRWSAPHVRCLLRFENVLACQIEVTDKLKCYQVSHLHFDLQNSELQVIGVCCVKIKARVGHLKGSITDLEERTSECFSKTTIGFTRFRK